MSRKNDIAYYMTLPYVIEITKIPEEKGGGYMACLPQFGRMAAVGDGDTIDEAIDNLEESKRALFEEYIKEGVQIPEPESEEEYSGRFVLRLPKYLHRELSVTAKRNNVSLNQYAVSLLSGALEADKLGGLVEGVKSEIQLLREHVCTLKYSIPKEMTSRNKKTFSAT
jgi:predicted HicB family RNase H-like nuclease